MFDDPAFDEFMSSFGDIRPQLKAQQDNRSKSLVMGPNETAVKKTPAIAMGTDGVSETTKDFALNAKGVSIKGQEFNSNAGAASAAAGVAGGLMDSAPQAIGLMQNLTGANFDTSAEGGGVGKGGGAIIQGGMQGAQLGMKVGGPWGAAIGAAVGAGGTALAHGAAKKEYVENRSAFNLKGNEEDQLKRAKEYAMSRGVGTMDMMKNVRQKQLGLMS